MRKLLGVVAFAFTLCWLATSAQADCPAPGYPFATGECLNVNELNKAFDMSAGTSPPANGQGQGADYGKWWLDTSVSPNNVVRLCTKTGGCSAVYNSAQWTSVFQVNNTSGAVTVLNVSTAPRTRIITSGITDTLNPTDGLVSWRSSSNAVKTETLTACSSANAGETHIIADGSGTSGTYAINVTAPGGGTINRSSSPLPINNNNAQITLVCDGLSDWVAFGNFGPLSYAQSLPSQPTDFPVITFGTAVITGTGSQNCTAIYCIWRPSSPALTTIVLPGSPTDKEWHVVDNTLLSPRLYPLKVSGDSIIMMGGTGATMILPPGSSVTFRRIAALSAWVVE